MGVKQVSGSEMQIDNTFPMIWLPILGTILCAFGIGLLFFPQIIGGTGDPALAGVVVLGMATVVFLLWADGWTRIRLSRMDGAMHVKRLLSAETYQMSQIKKVELAQERADSSEGGGGLQQALCFILENGFVLKYQDIAKNQDEASKVAAFVGVPFEYRPLPSFGQAIGMAMDALRTAMGEAKREYGKKQEGNA
jgi:hypothetical protein